jgi:molybdate transport system substrate-binding protein
VSSLSILSGGAAQGLVASLLPTFKERTGLDIVGHFGAVGAMADKLREGVPTDIVILTSALVAKLAEEKLVLRTSLAAVGAVETAIAVRAGDPRVSVGDAAALRAALLASDAIFVPDTKASTAGIHVAKVLGDLGIADEVATRLKVYPNGATAMRHLAASDALRPIGCTQATEIINTEGVELADPLPPGCELKTVYTAGVAAHAAKAEAAQTLINLLTAHEQNDLRARAGFLAA